LPEEFEWETRRTRINQKLTHLCQSWDISKYHAGLDLTALDRHILEEFPTANGPADYALFVKGKLLGIIEAKKVGVNPQNVLEQAKRYARGVLDGVGSWDGYGVPFLYATNGEVIYYLDARDKKNASRQIASFHTADALQEFFADGDPNHYDWFQKNPNIIEGLRDYQKEAIEKVEDAIANHKRAMLIAMATGTGKTFTTVALVHRLLESKTTRRILFLVDRKALAAQAVRSFNAFNTPKNNKFTQEYELYSQKFQREDFGDDQPFDPKVLPTSYLSEPQPSNTFVYVSTIQRMAMNLIGREGMPVQNADDPQYEEDVEKLDIPIHAFDVIIADECHRGYTASETSLWREVINYFDAIKIGLTATPAPHSLSLFNEVIYRYTIDEAIRDGFLVDYEAIKITSNVRMQGAFLEKGEHVGRVDTDTGQVVYDELEDERKYETGDIERRITSPDSNKKIVKEIAKYAYKHEEETGHFPKILIFAVNDLPHTSHADQIVKTCREEFGQGDDFVQKITGSASVDRPLQRIREFRNRPNPKIVITVDMLSTGVDIPSIEFIVFMRPVQSRILWVQMLGRGTRLCPEINKTHFKIFDCFDGTLIEYFKDTTDFNVEPPQKDPVPLKQVIENIYQNVDRIYFVKVLVRRLQRIEKDMSGKAREKFAAFIPDRDIGLYASVLPDKIKTDFTNTMKLLRDEKFQDLLLHYERAKRTFLIGYEVEDEVSSNVMFHVGSSHLKPQDYIDSFCEFVQGNQDKIDAIKVLLNRPKDWRTDVLNDLRTKLSQNDFEEAALQRAHKVVYSKALADVISMVKHAARKQEPLLSAEERAENAVAKVTMGKALSDEQKKWLGFIKEHLIQNLTIEIADFSIFPIFERAGGITRARLVFKNDFEILVKNLNEAIAA